MTKTCFKCRKKKEIEQFYKHPRMADGHLGKCKSCAKRDAHKRYVEYPEKIKSYELIRNQTEHRKSKKKIYEQKRRLNSPGKFRANTAVHNAVRDGRLIKSPCEICGALKVEAHHNDYRSPLKVRWLCFKHHRQVHGQLTRTP